MKSDYMITS